MFLLLGLLFVGCFRVEAGGWVNSFVEGVPVRKGRYRFDGWGFSWGGGFYVCWFGLVP